MSTQLENLPPYVDGIMNLSDEDKTIVKNKLIDIKNSFVPTDDLPVITTLYIVSVYNSSNDLQINGDTCESLLSDVGE